jgi:hypothetical protein
VKKAESFLLVRELDEVDEVCFGKGLDSDLAYKIDIFLRSHDVMEQIRLNAIQTLDCVRYMLALDLR